jgi:hypothetical protein
MKPVSEKVSSAIAAVTVPSSDVAAIIVNLEHNIGKLRLAYIQDAAPKEQEKFLAQIAAFAIQGLESL